MKNEPLAHEEASCATKGCEKKFYAKSLCKACYQNVRRYGTTDRQHKANTPREIRLAWLENILAEEPDDLCRDWPFGFSFKLTDVQKDVHWVCMILSGRPEPDPPRNYVLHSCDRSVCVAPWHLRWGTQAENVQDMMERRRHHTQGPKAKEIAAKISAGLIRNHREGYRNGFCIGCHSAHTGVCSRHAVDYGG